MLAESQREADTESEGTFMEEQGHGEARPSSDFQYNSRPV